MSKVKLAVFDCDGTLVDGQAAVCAAMEDAFTATGMTPPARHAIRRIVGLSLPQAVAQLVPDTTPHAQAAVVEAYKQNYRATRQSGLLHEPLYDGMEDLLRRLHADGWLLAVATGKSDRGLAACLGAHGIADLFVSLQTADRHPSKPHPAMLDTALGDALAEAGHAVMIGDTTYDMAMARAAGVRAIGVAWGYHEAEELVAAGAETVAQTMDELERLIRG